MNLLNNFKFPIIASFLFLFLLSSTSANAVCSGRTYRGSCGGIPTSSSGFLAGPTEKDCAQYYTIIDGKNYWCDYNGGGFAAPSFCWTTNDEHHRCAD